MMQTEVRPIDQPEAQRLTGGAPKPTAEANVFARSPSGFKVHFKLVFPEAGGVLTGLNNLEHVLTALTEKGYKPEDERPAQRPQQASTPRNGGNRSGVRQVQRQRPSADVPECEFCDGPVWDNSGNKRNPKAPDYKCKDKTCNGAGWIQEDGEISWKQ